MRLFLKDSVPCFTVKEGHYKGMSFRHGVAYNAVPPGEADKFFELAKPNYEDKKFGRRDGEAVPDTAPDETVIEGIDK